MSDPYEVEPLETCLQSLVPAVREVLAIYDTLANAVQGNEVNRAWEAALALTRQAQLITDELEGYQ
jgi:hypothetical protein